VVNASIHGPGRLLPTNITSQVVTSPPHNSNVMGLILQLCAQSVTPAAHIMHFMRQHLFRKSTTWSPDSSSRLSHHTAAGESEFAVPTVPKTAIISSTQLLSHMQHLMLITQSNHHTLLPVPLQTAQWVWTSS
jgi:hypothetical protein